VLKLRVHSDFSVACGKQHGIWQTIFSTSAIHAVPADGHPSLGGWSIQHGWSLRPLVLAIIASGLLPTHSQKACFQRNDNSDCQEGLDDSIDTVALTYQPRPALSGTGITDFFFFREYARVAMREKQRDMQSNLFRHGRDFYAVGSELSSWNLRTRVCASKVQKVLVKYEEPSGPSYVWQRFSCHRTWKISR
jgi:hypothetical protein